METLRFLMISTHYPPRNIGGDAVFVQYLSRELSRIGHEVHVLHSPAVYELLRGNSRPVDKLTDEGVVLHPYKGSAGHLDIISTVVLGVSNRAREFLERTADKIKPDVLHWHNTKAFFGRIPTVCAEKSMYTAHDYYAICPRSSLIRQDGSICAHARLCQWCLAKGGKAPQLWRIKQTPTTVTPEHLEVICPSESMANRLRSEGIRISHILPNFVPDPQAVARRTELDKRRMIYLGVLERHKGLDTLLDAFSQSRDNHGFELTIVGNGHMREHLIEKTREIGIEKRVRILGYMPRADIDKLLSESDAIVIPSEWPENAPLVALEALALGVPIIGSRAGGIPEIVGKDPDSMLFDMGDTDALAERMKDAWDREPGKIGVLSRQAYLNSFSPNAHLSKYLDIVRMS